MVTKPDPANIQIHLDSDMCAINSKRRDIFVWTLVLTFHFAGKPEKCCAAILFPAGPEGGQKVVLADVAQTVKSSPGVFHAAKAEELVITNAYKCYSVNMDGVLSGKLLSTATPACWSYFIMRGNETIGFAGLCGDGTNANVRLSFASGPAPLSVGLQKAANLARLEDYEFRYLDGFPIFFSGIWLHGKTNDIILPLPPSHEAIQAYQPYPEDVILKYLSREIEELKKRKHVKGVTD